jgi:hypothetical protein
MRFSRSLPRLDVFLMCDDGNGKKSYQIWINNKDAGFSLGQAGQLPSGVQSVSFADMGKQKLQFSCLSRFNEVLRPRRYN